MTMHTHTKGNRQPLIDQLDKIFRHNRQGSYRTKERYYEAMRRFCYFLADEYRLQKLANINGKHLTAYVLRMQEEGKSPSTIKTDLSAIRFFHDKISDAKYDLPSNDELTVKLERRSFGGVDRSWSEEEFNRMLGKALAENRYDYILALYLARYAGLRIHECFRLDTAAAEDALRKNAITIKGKGGKIRTIPINEPISIALREQLNCTERGHKLLVPDEMDTDYAMYRLQQFIRDHREEIQNPDSDRPMTFHGLRHTYASETYTKLLQQGKSPLDARYEVSRLLGHERADVTNIYLASVNGGKKDDS
ncbi:tyrosine-type recombinase/integrase [Pseudoflavonifractor sp. P01025]|uniref:tyrosine-type recombinase/integrase n=1 Tax=Flintibacter porci TaxID=3342383 RepID=UPI0035B63D62